MHKTAKNIAVAAVAAGAVAAFAAVPEVTYVHMEQASSSREVTIQYKFTGDDAVITLDVETNNAAGGWASIGGEAVCNAQGEVWRKVEKVSDNTVHVIKWHPDHSWKDAAGNGFKVADGGARAKVTAWALDNTPDYMVVDITAGAQQNTQRYYPAVDFLPGSSLGQKGAVTNNAEYKTTQLVMRKIMASGVKWTMGSTTTETKRDDNEATHLVELTNNYYIGVFQITQAQWAQIRPGDYPSFFTVDRDMRPVDKVSFNNVRMASGGSNTADANAREWPAAPFAGSWLDQLRSRTGLDFDLPSEAQWEFACRAGHGSGYWGDGSKVLNVYNDTNLAKIGRFTYNGGFTNNTVFSQPPGTVSTANGTAVVGSYLPNSWGLYDMHGNVYEWCLDKYTEDISALNGRVNLTGDTRCARGGNCCSDWETAKFSRSAYRKATVPSEGYPGWAYGMNGLRVTCTAGLK